MTKKEEFSIKTLHAKVSNSEPQAEGKNEKSSESENDSDRELGLHVNLGANISFAAANDTPIFHNKQYKTESLGPPQTAAAPPNQSI